METANLEACGRKMPPLVDHGSFGSSTSEGGASEEIRSIRAHHLHTVNEDTVQITNCRDSRGLRCVRETGAGAEIRLWACPVPTLFSKAPIGRQVPGQCWWRVWGFQRLAVVYSGWLARKATRFQLGSPAKALIPTTHPYSPTWWLEFWDTDGVRQSQQYMSDVHPLDWKISPRRTKVHFRKTQVPQPPKTTHLRAYSPRHERGVQPEIRRAESRDDGDDVYFVLKEVHDAGCDGSSWIR
ncbi:hypothetical protein BKA56DRAFT_278715 [Ilyonectria sp. MPI-CAGE-AT-0026]|nr:hypothetical protein BKA56DRAFT_278715 [Ilyonectria sp. MPI-CAGE-AT-0026]